MASLNWVPRDISWRPGRVYQSAPLGLVADLEDFEDAGYLYRTESGRWVGYLTAMVGESEPEAADAPDLPTALAQFREAVYRAEVEGAAAAD